MIALCILIQKLIHQPLKFFASKKRFKKIGLIIIPGGGYKNIAYKWEGITTSNYFNSRGFATFILKYRTPQSKSVKISHLAPIQDAQGP